MLEDKAVFKIIEHLKSNVFCKIEMYFEYKGTGK